MNGLITPNLLKFGNNFYNCALIESVPLENERFDRSIGANFERASFFNETMTASDIKNVVFSGFTFNLLKDSGWYGVEERYFENLSANKNMGCLWL